MTSTTDPVAGPAHAEECMHGMLRRLRGAAGIVLLWGAGWAALGVCLTLAVGVVRPEEIDPGEGASRVAGVLGVAGMLAGAGFSALLLLRERRQTIAELSIPRVALWGTLGAAAIPALMGAPIGEGWVTGVLGGAFAAGSVAMARRAALRDGERVELLEP